MTAQDALYALRARKAGARYQLRIVREAKAAGVQLSLAFALVDEETGGTFRNVYGHDEVRNPIKSPPGGLKRVTRSNYALYKHYRQQGLGMQGVGPCQLTWWETQDLADREGGCWNPTANIRVALRQLAANIRQYGRHTGIARYNGSGSAAEAYARSVEAKQQKWHRILEGGRA